MWIAPEPYDRQEAIAQVVTFVTVFGIGGLLWWVFS
jgi:hypothetical protein